MDTRRSEEEEPLSPSRRQSNVFGDEYEVIGVADGFRPDDLEDDDSRPQQHTIAAQYASNPVMSFSPDPSGRSSTRKSPSFDNPFISPEESTTPLARAPSVRSTNTNYAPGIAGRSFSSASSHLYAATDSPRLAAAGPSHPYTMYPQGTIVRSPSVATASTNVPARRSTSLRGGPQHPYAMYTQGVETSDDEGEETAANPVPVGFGLGQTYRRVRGPEGEEQDIIGEYGHAEQLPPYSRYPVEGPEKAPLLAVPEDIHSRAPVPGTDPGMPLMHQRMSRQSMTDASQLEQSAPLLSDTESASPESEESSFTNEKKWKDKSWKEKRSTKVCGVRFGWIVVALSCLGVIFAILIGSLVGYWAGVKNLSTGTFSGAATTTLTTSLWDASVIATPTGAGPLSGPFALTLGAPQAVQTGCIAQSSQQAAWNCNLVGKPAVVMSVGLPPVATPTNSAFLFYSSDDTNISYGAQYQFMATDASPLIPVRDNDDPAFGPAYFFQSTYDKVVVVPHDTFPTPNMHKRQVPERIEWNDEYSRRKSIVTAGEKPWFCFFNKTAIEGFIYIQKQAALNTTSSNTSATASTTSSPLTTAPPTSSSTMTQLPSSMAAYLSSKKAAAEAARGSSSIVARDLEERDDNWANLYPYPSVVKIEERRVPNNTVTPYCQQYQILDDGSYNIVVDSQHNPILFYIDEQISASAYKRSSAGGCHCQWLHGTPS